VPSVVLNSNVASLQAQRRLGQGSAGLSKSLERLSSGLRINRAGDDAAGLSISESLKADRRISNQGIRNFNDGLSLLSVADATVESLSNIVIRLKELAEQAANGVYGKAQRKALDQEAQKLSAEYTRIAQSAQFNNVKLFDGSFGSVVFQGGVSQNGGISTSMGGAIGTGSFSAGVSLGFSVNVTEVADLNTDGVDDIVIAQNGSIGIAISNGNGTFQAVRNYTSLGIVQDAKAGDFNGDGILDVAATDTTSVLSVYYGNGNGTFRSAVSVFSVGSVGNIAVGDFNGDGRDDLAATDGSGTGWTGLSQSNGTFGAFISVSTSTALTLASGDLNNDGFDDLIFNNFASDLIRVKLSNGDGYFRTRTLFTDQLPYSSTIGDINNDGKLDIVTAASNGDALDLFLGNGDGTFVTLDPLYGGDSPRSVALGDVDGDGNTDLIYLSQFDSALNIALGNGNGTFRASVSTSAAFGNYGAIQLGDFNGDGVSDMTIYDPSSANDTVRFGNTRTGAGPLAPFTLKNIAGARQALASLSLRLSQLSIQRGSIGALQSRVGTAINALQVSSENVGSAISRITDVDVAEESSQLLKQRIIQNAAVGILAQANAQPALALRLLGRSGKE